MSEEIDNLKQQLLLAGKYGQSLMIENNEVRALRIMTTCSHYIFTGPCWYISDHGSLIVSSMEYGAPPT